MALVDAIENNTEAVQGQTLAREETLAAAQKRLHELQNPGPEPEPEPKPEKEEKWDVEKENLSVAKKSGLFLLKILHIENKTQRERREERRENARKQDRGFKNPLRYLLGAEKEKKGGLFGMLKSIGKGVGGSFMKVIGPMWKILKVLFKVLKFTALGAALIAGALFFSMSESDQQATIDSVMGFFKKVGEVLSSLGKAFGGAFMKTMDDMTDEEGNPIEGLVSKFGKFKEAWAGVLKKLSGISMNVGGKTYKGLEGFASMMGDLFGKIAGWFLDIGTAIAELITDPRKMLTKMSVAISNFFGGIIDTVFRFVDEFTSMEFLLSLLPPWVREIGFVQEKMKTASQERAKDKMKDMEDLAARDRLLLEREEDAQKSYDESAAKIKAIDDRLNNEKIKLSDTEREKLEAEKEGYDNDRIAVYDLLMESKAERERNKDRFEYAKESYEASTEIALKEAANQILMKKKNVNFIAVEEQLAEQEKEKRELLEDHVEGSGMIGEIELSLSKARQVEKLLGDPEKLTQTALDKSGMAIKLAKLGIKADDTSDLSKIKDLLEGLATREKDLLDKEAEIVASKKEKADIAPEMKKALELARKESEAASGVKIPALVDPNAHTGGYISESGIIAAQKGEIIIDDVLVNTFKTAAEVMSGMKLMDLQRQASVVQTQGGSPIIISNAPTTQVNQNQAMVLPPSPIQPGNSEATRLIN
jgi:hypothetical protein